jgi:membrane peptidoglycan carboxypeptidase
VARRSDRSDVQLLLGPRHGAEDGAGRRAYETYADLDPFGTPPAKGRFIDYPRRARRGWTRWIPSWRLVLSLVLLCVAALCVTVLVLYSRTVLPTKQNADTRFQTTVVSATNGKQIGTFSAQTRYWKPLKDIPILVQNAVLAAEDRTFRTNQGVNVTSVVRAALNNLRGGPRQGGSTITQQYVKNAFSSTTDRSWSRKLDEFFVSIKAAQTLSKDDILENYLNIIYFGRGCYGVQAAAQCYFHKDIDQLTPSEAAYLAGIIKGPELYDSPGSEAAAQARWQYVMDGMATEGWISARQRAKAKPPTVQPRPTAKAVVPGDQTEYLLGMVRDEAERTYGITEQELQTGGYRISTTFDPDKIRDAQQSIRDVLGPHKSWPKGTQVAVATIDTSNGAVVSVYAGDGDRDSNAVTQDIAQAGSTFKPFTLIAALEGKRDPGSCAPQAPGPGSLSLRSRVDGRSPQKFGGRLVHNDEGNAFGYVDLVTATAESVNTAYMALNQKIGAQHTEDVAICAGLPAPDADGNGGTLGLGHSPNNVLGVSSPHPIDMARAYATIAAGGVYHDTYWIKSIKKADGSLLVPERKNDGKRVFDASVIADTTYAMQAVVKSGTGSYVRNLGRPVAGKTGTTEKNRAAWFAGFTPQFATVVVMQKLDKTGNPVSLVPFAGLHGAVYGGTLPARVWTSYMRTILQGMPVKDFPQPVFGGTAFNAAPTPTATPSTSPSASTSTSAPAAPTPTPTPTASEPEPSPSDSSPTPEPSATDTDPAPVPSPPGLPRPRPKPTPRP